MFLELEVYRGTRPVRSSLNELGRVSMLTTTCQDARFEVLGSPYSLLSVTLSPSQQLYTRRGTLVAVAGKAENVRLDAIVTIPKASNNGRRPNLRSRFCLPSLEPSSAFLSCTNGSRPPRLSRP